MLLKFVKEKIKSALLRIFIKVVKNKEVDDYQNIIVNINKLSSQQTAEYVLKNLLKTPKVNSRFELYDFVLKDKLLPGYIFEFGVYNGVSINYIANKINKKSIYGFDSFEGLPEDWRTGFKKGAFNLDGIFPKVESNVVLIKGWFEDSIPKFLTDNEVDFISLLHFDCDLYSSTKTILNNLEGSIKKGTIIIFDEYFNHPGWQEGEFKAFQEFVRNKNIVYKYLVFNNYHEQVAIEIL